MLSIYDNSEVRTFGPASFRGGVPKAPRPRKGPEFFCLSLVNTTSLSPHWRMLSEAQADVLVVTETHATEFEQASIGVGLRYKGWTPHWSLPVVQGPSGAMSGRSGGTAVWLRSPWVASKVTGLELEVTQQYYQALRLWNPETQATFILIAYYGRPQQRDVTLRDHQRIMEFCVSMNEDAILAGDFNINDGDPHELPLADELVDAAWWSAGEAGPEPTCYVGALASRLDRVYVSPSYAGASAQLLCQSGSSCTWSYGLKPQASAEVCQSSTTSCSRTSTDMLVLIPLVGGTMKSWPLQSGKPSSLLVLRISALMTCMSNGQASGRNIFGNLLRRRGPQTRGVVRPPVQDLAGSSASSLFSLAQAPLSFPQ